MTGRLVIGVLVVLAVAFALHFLAIWAEGRGWIYYRKGRGRNWSVGAATQELQSLLQPLSKHVVEEARRETLERHDEDASSDE